MTVHDQLRSLLVRVRRRWRAEAVLRAIGRAAVLAAAPLLAGAGLALWLALDDGTLTVLALAVCLAALAGLGLTVWQLGRTPAIRQVARFVEERVALRSDVPPLDDVLVSAVEEASLTAPRDFRDLVVEAAVRRLQGIDAADIITNRALSRAGAVAAAGMAVLAVSIGLAWPMLAKATEAAWITVFPQSIQVEVLPGDARLPAGQPLTIRASVRAGGDFLTRFTPRLTVEAGTPDHPDVRTVAMTPDGGGFVFSFESIDRSFRYRVTAGAKRSKDYTVTALVGARVARIDLRYEYPAFAKLPPHEQRDAGDIYAPAGTKVRVRVHTDKPIAAGQMMFAGSGDSANIAESGVLKATGDQVLEGELVLARDDSYRVRLTDRDGLRTSGDTEYFVRVMDDRPPDVRILRPAADQQITPLEEVAIEARAEDDYGLSRFELVYAVAGRESKVVPFARTSGTDLARVGTHTLAAEDLGVQPGDVVTYYARARDVGRGKRPSETRSDIFFLEVRPFSEEFVLAQSQAMSGMASEQIETLVAAQKEIINATWNIERRAASGAGRSAGDVTAIAAAQAELRTRAEQIAPATGRGSIRFPQQVTTPRQLRGPRSGPDPVSAAISAMTRAIGQLEGQRTGEALTHEMAALQGLLQAQSEVRRREVAQQAGASMGGMGRQGQDLSALFDKELQRQQRTNYETRSQAETRADRQEGETALDKIRDLAKRQEEFARRQRELAGRHAVCGRDEAAARKADARAGSASSAGRGSCAPAGTAGGTTPARRRRAAEPARRGRAAESVGQRRHARRERRDAQRRR